MTKDMKKVATSQRQMTNDLMERLISVCGAGGRGPIHKSWQAGQYEVAAITDR